MPTNLPDILRLEPGQFMDALDGDDRIYWAGGNATLRGGADDFDPNPYIPYDLEIGGIPTGDRLYIEGDGASIRMDDWNAGTAWLRGEGGRTSVTFEGIERVHGTAGNDTIRAGQAATGEWNQGVSIFAGAGNDDIIGSSGNDNLDGGVGDDTIRAGAGDDFIQSTTGDDLIYGGAGMENIRWGLGDATWHNPGDDTIHGGDGHDLLNAWVWEGGDGVGSPGAVTEIRTIRADGGFAGTSTVGTGDGQTATVRFAGIEQGWHHLGDDTVTGAGAELRGATGFHWNTRWGDDLITGSAGNDTLEGGEGRDTITGGAGDDLISANGDYFRMDAPADADADVLIFRAGDGNDTVLAFDPTRDTLDTGGREYVASATAAGLLLDFGGGDSILLAGVDEWWPA